jgi:Na+-transporting NADH:ubiquinone oxidoreductase subunit C
MTPPRISLLRRLYPAWFMLGITLVFMSAVTGAHLQTADLVSRNQSLYLKRAVLLAGGLTPPAENAAVEKMYAEKVHAREGSPPQDGWLTVEGEAGRAFVLPASGAGLWGEITAMVGFREDRSLSGIAFTRQNETPGLGARITEAWFTSQFNGKRPPLSLVAEGTRSSSPEQIDAITGASITSKAVRDIVNRTAEKGVPEPGKDGA